MQEAQSLKEQTQMLASIAISHNGTASNKVMLKKLGTSKVVYKYVRYLFDFDCTAIDLQDKIDIEHLVYLTASVHLKIDDNLCVIIVKGVGGYKKVLTQLNATTITLLGNVLTLDSPTCHMELR